VADASVDGNLDRLAITGGINAPFAASFDGAALTLNKNWNWQGASQVTRFDLQAWGAGKALGVITGQLQLQGDRTGFHARGALTPPGLAAGALQVEFDGNYADRIITAERIQLQHRASGTQLTGKGTIGIVADGPQLALTGNWSNLRWPLADATAPVHSSGGAYSLQGKWPYALQASGELRVKELPAMHFDGAGALARDRLLVNQAQLDAFGGSTSVTGAAAWSPAESWQLQGAMRDLNLEALRPGIRGRLAFQWMCRL
jgi:autotransporter translocation and assembly factor TamB